MPRHFEPISEEKLAVKIQMAIEESEDMELLKEDEYDLSDASGEVYRHCYGVPWRTLTPVIKKDLKKVEFDLENVELTEWFAIKPASDAKRIMGFQILPNGLSFLGITAGGEWENSVHFIIYWDGQNLRGYVPRKGNTWNTVNNMAVGNCESDDAKFLKKLKPDSDKEVADAGDFNDILWIRADDILADIQERILPRT